MIIYYSVMFLPVSLGLSLLGNWYFLLGLLCKYSALETKWRLYFLIKIANLKHGRNTKPISLASGRDESSDSSDSDNEDVEVQ